MKFNKKSVVGESVFIISSAFVADSGKEYIIGVYSVRKIFFLPYGGVVISAYKTVVIQALSEKRRLLITYNSISHGNYTDKKIEPYFIKERLRRWYIVGRAEGHDNVEVFAFDRIEKLSLLGEKFEFDPNIDPKTYFNEVVGILLDDEYDCERVVVRLYGKQAEYVNLLPLHKSQKTVSRGKNYIDFEYMLRPEWEFIHEVLRLGYEAEVLSPAWVREELKWQAQEIVKRYDEPK